MVGSLLELGVGRGTGNQVVLEAQLGGGLVEALRVDPAVELLGPSLVVAWVAAPMAQQEALDSLLRPATVVLEVLARPDELAQALFGPGSGPGWR